MMAANAGVIKAIVSFYCVISDTALKRHRSRIPKNDLNTVHAIKKHKALSDATETWLESDNLAITTDDHWKLELPSMLDDSGREMNRMYFWCLCICFMHVVVYNKPAS